MIPMMETATTTTTTRIDATPTLQQQQQPRSSPSPPLPDGAGNRTRRSAAPTLQVLKMPRNEKKRQEFSSSSSSSSLSSSSSSSSSFRKVVFISFLAFVAFFQLFRNLGNNSNLSSTIGGAGFATRAVVSKQQQQHEGTISRITSSSSSSSTLNKNMTTASGLLVESKILSSDDEDSTVTVLSSTLPEKAFTSSSLVLSKENNATSTHAATAAATAAAAAAAAALQEKINHWRLSLSSKNKTMLLLLPQPPHTLGAFIHVGKTGGSTLCSQLRNACHSWVKKPCPQKPRIRNESHLSLLTTYYHTPDFHLLSSKRHYYDFYVWTLRDPFSRLLSAFTYQHPRNMGHAQDDKYWAKYVRQSIPAFACFPSLVRERERERASERARLYRLYCVLVGRGCCISVSIILSQDMNCIAFLSFAAAFFHV
jgi:Sulfotransferase family